MSVGVTLCKERVGQGIVFCLGVPAFQNGSAGEKELYVAFQVKGAGPVSPGQQGNFAAAAGRRGRLPAELLPPAR